MKNDKLTPYCIQRGFFNTISDEQIVGLDCLVKYDYMGSAEFEWGALPNSLTQLCNAWATYEAVKIEKIKDSKGRYLYFIARKEDSEDIREVLVNLFTKESPYRLKEHSECYEYLHGSRWNNGEFPRTDFWWDIDHHWMACFGENIRRLIKGIEKVCEKKSLPKEGAKTPPGAFRTKR